MKPQTCDPEQDAFGQDMESFQKTKHPWNVSEFFRFFFNSPFISKKEEL